MKIYLGAGRRDSSGGDGGAGSGAGAFCDSGIGTEYEKYPCGGSGSANGFGYPCGGGDGDRFASYYSENADTQMGYGDGETSGDQFGGGDTGEGYEV